ncbi:hypothetical protein [Brevibacillus porteri]|nr:hypothetical protein [Brevibacillus porteri]MED2135058.1 hypothetical protein [Brevibacillus porteri]MED2894760.1 hypothetical protein [Brevibacillus porteri]
MDKDNHTQDAKRYAMYNDWLMLLLAQKREDRKKNGKGGWI